MQRALRPGSGPDAVAWLVLTPVWGKPMVPNQQVDVNVCNLIRLGSCTPGSPFYVVVETRGSVAEHDVAKLDAFLEVRVWRCAL